MIPNNVLQIIGQFVPNIREFQNVNSPDELAQKLLNSGRVNQTQVNQAKQLWNRSDIRQMIGNRFHF